MNKKIGLDIRLHFLKQQNFFCDDNPNNSQTTQQQDQSRNIYYKIDEMKQSDQLIKDRSHSDWNQYSGNSQIQQQLKNNNSTLLSQNSILRQNDKQNKLQLANSYYFTSSSLSPQQTSLIQSNVRQISRKLQKNNNIKYLQLKTEQSYTDSQRSDQGNGTKINLDTQKFKTEPDQDIDSISNFSTTPRLQYNYRTILQLSPFYSPRQQTTQQSEQANNKDSIGQLLNKNNGNDQNLLNFKKSDSIYDNEESETSSRKLSEIQQDFSIQDSDLILEDSNIQKNNIKTPNSPSFLKHQNDETNDYFNLEDYYKLDSQLQSKQVENPELSLSQQILENPKKFFEKLGIQPVQLNKTKKKSLHKILEDSIESELKYMEEFNQDEIEDKHLNSQHYQSFLQNSQSLLEDQEQKKIKTLKQDMKRMSSFQTNSPRNIKQKSFMEISQKSNNIKQSLKIKQQDITSDFLQQNCEELNIEFLIKQKNAPQIKLKDLILKNKDKQAFSKADNFKKVSQFQKISKFQDIIKQTCQNQERKQVDFNLTQQNQSNNSQKTVQILSRAESIQQIKNVQNQIHQSTNMPGQQFKISSHFNAESPEKQQNLIKQSSILMNKNRDNQKLESNDGKLTKQFSNESFKLISQNSPRIIMGNQLTQNSQFKDTSHNKISNFYFKHLETKEPLINDLSNIKLKSIQNLSSTRNTQQNRNKNIESRQSNKAQQIQNTNSNRSIASSNSNSQQRQSSYDNESKKLSKIKISLHNSMKDLHKKNIIDLNQNSQKNSSLRNKQIQHITQQQPFQMNNKQNLNQQEQKQQSSNTLINFQKRQLNSPKQNNQQDISKEQKFIIKKNTSELNLSNKQSQPSSQKYINIQNELIDFAKPSKIQNQLRDLTKPSSQINNLIQTDQLKSMFKKKEKLTILQQSRKTQNNNNQSAKYNNTSYESKTKQNLSNFTTENYHDTQMNEEERELQNMSMLQTKQDMKEELNKLQRHISSQNETIQNMKHKRGEYLPSSRAKPSNQFIYDQMFYSKHIHLFQNIQMKKQKDQSEPL